MLMPEQMNRILLVGSKADLKATIDMLYKVEAVDIVDFSAEEEGFSFGIAPARVIRGLPEAPQAPFHRKGHAA